MSVDEVVVDLVTEEAQTAGPASGRNEQREYELSVDKLNSSFSSSAIVEQQVAADPNNLRTKGIQILRSSLVGFGGSGNEVSFKDFGTYQYQSDGYDIFTLSANNFTSHINKKKLVGSKSATRNKVSSSGSATNNLIGR